MQKTVTVPVICVLILLIVIVGIQSYALICCGTDEEAKMWIDRSSLAIGIVVAALLCMSVMQLNKMLKDKSQPGDDSTSPSVYKDVAGPGYSSSPEFVPMPRPAKGYVAAAAAAAA